MLFRSALWQMYEEERDGRIKDNVESILEIFNLGKEKKGLENIIIVIFLCGNIFYVVALN